MALSAALGVLPLAGGCRAAPPVGPSERAAVRVRSFTEATPVQHILAVPPYAFAATTAGLDRWDLRSGQAVHLGSEHGLPGERVLALDYDQGGELWIATDAGLVRYDVEAAVFHEVPPPQGSLAVDSFEGATIATVPSGAWIGLPGGLFHVTRAGEWSASGINAPVTNLMVEPDGNLVWVGTVIGLFVSQRGATTEFGPERGCDLAAVRFIARAPDGRVVVVGENASREQRIALASPDGCDSYRVSSDESWVTAASRPGELLVLSDRRLYAMRPSSRALGRALVRDGMQLLPVPRSDGRPPKSCPFALEALSGELPAGAQTLAAFGDEVLVGTRSLGTARVVSGRQALQWLRRGELMGDATSLSVACAALDDCYVATGSTRAWRFDGERFSLSGGGGGRRVLAVARDPDGRLIGLRQTADGRRIAVAEIRQDEWRETGITVETPGRDPELAFARFSPGGILWLGLRDRDDDGKLRPYGVALVDLALSLVEYHHASEGERETERGTFPIPIDAADVDFTEDNAAWLATSQGAVEIEGKRMTTFGEVDGLRSELLRAVAWSAGGTLYVAESGGVGIFDGATWSYPRELAFAVNDMETGPDQRLWMATDRGLAVHDASGVRRFDARRGLVENHIEDLTIDQFGRVWLRGPQSLGIVY